jgi:hypothetical protein
VSMEQQRTTQRKARAASDGFCLPDRAYHVWCSVEHNFPQKGWPS